MNPVQKTIVYLKKSVKAILKQPSLTTVADIFRFFPQWWRHLEAGRSPFTDAQPWISFGAISFIRKILRPDMYVFEYGSGGSTLFWAEHVKKVVSVEHEPDWFRRMDKAFREKGMTRVEYIFSGAESNSRQTSPNYKDPGEYQSADPQFAGSNFETYVRQIDRFPDHYFDIIVVDGRARNSCILHALPKLKSKGYLIVDNSERAYYLAPFQFHRPEWNRWDFMGPVPYNFDFSQTTILQKR